MLCSKFDSPGFFQSAHRNCPLMSVIDTIILMVKFTVQTGTRNIISFKILFYMMQMFGRTIKCSIAKDNGRAAEFIRRKEYKDKSQCYECGVRHQFSSLVILGYFRGL